jgi:hypothetical protein
MAIHHSPATRVGVKAEQGCGMALKWAGDLPNQFEGIGGSDRDRPTIGRKNCARPY